MQRNQDRNYEQIASELTLRKEILIYVIMPKLTLR